MQALLITDCLQNDFVGPIAKFDGLPNALHVGHDESLRLLGPNPAEGPVARVIAWAHAQPDHELKVIHVRDWHDPTDPRQRTHLEQFGAHCVQGTTGADFVFRSDDVTAGKHIDVVDATTLSNFIGADLDASLAPFAGRALRVGLMGVWTEAKITFLAYELRARYPDFQIAVCPALTASSSRQNHFLALDQLERILGVRILDSVGEFVDFLGGQIEDMPLIGFSEKHPQVDSEDGSELSDTDRQLVRYLFRGCRQVSVRTLDGGFSGNAVLATRSIDLHGHEQVPHVVKIGEKRAIGQERTAFERIEGVLGNSAPRITDFADLGARGAIKYRYAAMGRGLSRSFQQLYAAGASDGEIQRILDAVFIEQLGRLYRAAEPEQCDLLAYYDFSSRWAPSVRAKVVALLGEPGAQDVIEFPGGRRVANIVGFYERLDTLPRTPRFHYHAHLHGDLNGANLIVDGQGNVWLIDFFHAHRGHVLKDLTKLENDLLYIFTSIENEQQLEQALVLSDLLLSVEDLGAPLPPLDEAVVVAPALRRAYRTVAHLRSYYPDLVKKDREPNQLLVGQIRYAVHTLSFDEASSLQKRWALYTASSAAARLRRRLTATTTLRIDWLPDELTTPGAIGLTWLPGRRDAGRAIDDDVARIVAAGVSAVVCLLDREEFQRYGVDTLLDNYRHAGLDVLHCPTLDGWVPNDDELRQAVEWVESQRAAGKRVLVHCVGGLGRAGTIAACWLRHTGTDAQTAIDLVRRVRSQRAIETAQQERAIHAYPPVSTKGVPWRVRAVEPLPDYRLRVCFNDGTTGIVRMKRLIESDSAGVFSALADPSRFAEVRVELGAVSWPGDIDLAPDAMHTAIVSAGEWVP
ncbi:isochorismatase family protein [Sinimarinibacterium flocculans]|uniref:isochorismatase family protein n=1 Tax=Sinimarinibacterium flocculans TaxID=985250 RepID=UPI003511E8BA